MIKPSKVVFISDVLEKDFHSLGFKFLKDFFLKSTFRSI